MKIGWAGINYFVATHERWYQIIHERWKFNRRVSSLRVRPLNSTSHKFSSSEYFYQDAFTLSLCSVMCSMMWLRREWYLGGRRSKWSQSWSSKPGSRTSSWSNCWSRPSTSLNTSSLSLFCRFCFESDGLLPQLSSPSSIAISGSKKEVEIELNSERIRIRPRKELP